MPIHLRRSQYQPVVVPQNGGAARGKYAHSGGYAPVYNYYHTLLPIQPKLTINTPGDQYEQEADQKAAQVIQMQGASTISSNTLQRKCAARENENKPLAGNSGGFEASPGFASQLNTTQGAGAPLPADTRQSMEQSFGFDFSRVRIHTDERAAQMSGGIAAKAFTHGSDIYFNRGEYAPHTSVGKRLLAHELTHTIQQNKGLQRKMVQRNGEDKKKAAKEDAPVKTEVEVVTEHDVEKKETKTEATTTRSSEQPLSPGVSVKAAETTAPESTKGSAEVKAKDKASGLSASAGIKAESPTDPMKADTAKGFIKVGGQWKFFNNRIQTGFTTGLESDFAKAPKWSADWKTAFFPNGTLTPEIAFGLVYGDKGLSGKIDPSIAYKLSEKFSIKVGVPVTIGPGNTFNVTPGVGITLSF